MKLSIFCALLLICSIWVINQQKQKLEELKVELAASSERVDKLQEELAKLKQNAASQAAQAVQSSAPAGQRPPPAQSGAWMYGKETPNPLDAHGSHK